jgi:hypothetical protein
MYLGRLGDSAASLGVGIALLRDDDDYLGWGFSEDFSVTLRHWLAWTQWLRGESDEAWSMSQRSLAMVRARDPFTLGYGLVWNGVVALLREDLEAVRALATEASALAAVESYELIEPLAAMQLATARGLRGDPRVAGESADAFVAALGRMGSSGNRSGAGLILSFLVRLQLRAERLADAESTLSLALGLSSETGSFFDAELLRLRAEAALRRSDRTRAEADLRAAVEIARTQGARTFEARALAMLEDLSGT